MGQFVDQLLVGHRGRRDGLPDNSIDLVITSPLIGDLAVVTRILIGSAQCFA
jgi:hypothetical protein